ncbi:MAG: hypothetical protein IPL46_25630 [Saprospiraceae bacterium]|nr:hypothetical protein [Saprospiraceae bacterium]
MEKVLTNRGSTALRLEVTTHGSPVFHARIFMFNPFRVVTYIIDGMEACP